MNYNFFCAPEKFKIEEFMKSENLEKFAEFIDYHDTEECFKLFLEIVGDMPDSKFESEDKYFILKYLLLFYGAETNIFVYKQDVDDELNITIGSTNDKFKIKNPIKGDPLEYIRVNIYIDTSYLLSTDSDSDYELINENFYNFDSEDECETIKGGIAELEINNTRIISLPFHSSCYEAEFIY